MNARCGDAKLIDDDRWRYCELEHGHEGKHAAIYCGNQVYWSDRKMALGELASIANRKTAKETRNWALAHIPALADHVRWHGPMGGPDADSYIDALILMLLEIDKMPHEDLHG